MKDLPDYSGEFDPNLKMQDFSKDTLVRLLTTAGKLYSGLDGLWVAEMRKRLGDRAAFDLDKEIWETGTLVELRRVTETLNIKGNDVAAVFKYLQADPGFGVRIECEFDLKNADHGVMTVTRCNPLLMFERKGDDELQKVICEEIEIPAFQAVAEYFNPNMTATPLKLPPRNGPDDIACQWEFRVKP